MNFCSLSRISNVPWLCRQASRSVWFHCRALSRCVSSDVIMINVNHAGFTVCLFYGAVGRAGLGPSARAPAGSAKRWTRGPGWCLPSYSACNTACVKTEQRLCCHSDISGLQKTHWFFYWSSFFRYGEVVADHTGQHMQLSECKQLCSAAPLQ